MNQTEIEQRIESAMDTIDPNWRGDGGMNTGWTSYRAIERGEKYDVILRQAGRLFGDYERAIRTALGSHCGTITGD